MCMYMYMFMFMCKCKCVKVYVYAHMYMFSTFHNGFIEMYIFYIMNRGSRNIRNGIAWAQTGHGTFT